MPLYIKDAEVSGLAEDAVKYLGAPNKTEAVRQALKAAIAEAKAKIPLEVRIKDAQALADKLGRSTRPMTTRRTWMTCGAYDGCSSTPVPLSPF